MTSNSTRRGIIGSFFGGLIEVIDDQPNYLVTSHIYTVVIGWHFLELIGYLYSDENVTLTNEYNKLV